MAVSDIFDCLCCGSCGLCCSKDVLCEHCEISTLKANGLSVKYVNEIRGLKYKSPNHGNGFGFSQLYYKLIELQKRQKENWIKCIDCDWEGDVIDCDTDTEYDEFKGMDRKYPICPKCGGGVE